MKRLHHDNKNFKIMKNSIIIAALVLFGSFTFNQQETRIVTGTVYDENGAELPGVSVIIKGSSNGTSTDVNGWYQLSLKNSDILSFTFVGYKTQERKVSTQKVIDVNMVPDVQALEEVVIVGYGTQRKSDITGAIATVGPKERKRANKNYRANMKATGAVTRSVAPMATYFADEYEEDVSYNTEEYDQIKENIFKVAKNAPLSTFSIDVDAASYSNVRRMILNGQKPYADAVRIEEMINYFTYDYKNPEDDHPFSVNTEVSTAPWNPEHQLVHIGIQGKKLDTETKVNSNLVFLIDVSGSMSDANKLPLLKKSMKLLVSNMSDEDRISIVVYAGAAGLVLPPTPATDKQRIYNALSSLQSGGSTAGGAGIKLAYKVAEDSFIEGGNNRVILATDGDFNTGTSSTSEMVRLIEKKRKSGVYLTITGFGMGNYKDGRMEQISNAGNGNYFYIDSYKEAAKVFGAEMQATLFTIAKDVKLQVEFNPAVVQAYRLVGYENRKLNDEDFNDDKVDAGELGAGHSVTALYEIIPVGVKSKFVKDINPLKYQATQGANNNELMTVNIRYKPIDSDKSILINNAVKNTTKDIKQTNENFRFSAAVAQFGMLLRDSEFKQSSNLNNTLALAKGAKGNDEMGYRQEFIDMIRNYGSIEGQQLN